MIPDTPNTVEFTEEWWRETTQTPEGLATAFEIIRETVQERDRLLVERETHET